MLEKVIFVYLLGVVFGEKGCYWNAPCPFQMYSTKTPYDSVRGDIRDYADPQNCEAVSIWSLHRHGNRNPGDDDTDALKKLVTLKEEIISSFEAGRGHLCAQDIEDFRKWSWNETMEVSQAFLTGTGYEELFNIGKRIRERYPHLLHGENSSYYFRPTSEQRTVTSSIAFVHGLTDGTSLTLPIDDARIRDDVIRPYKNCDRYDVEAKGGQQLVDEMNDYYNSTEFQAVRTAVQHRLGIPTQLSSSEVYDIYDMCRFFRSWTPNLKSPWCAAFTDEDLVVLEYSDDVRHYYRNGYGSSVNEKLGGPTLKDLYESFEAVTQNKGRNIVSYFTHDTMMEMVFSTLGVFKDGSPLRGARRDNNRLWRTSFISSFAVNFIAVLNRCNESENQTYRVQFFINEKQTELCPLEGCTWHLELLQEKFQPFTNSNLEFCSTEYALNAGLNGSGVILTNNILLVLVSVLYLRYS